MIAEGIDPGQRTRQFGIGMMHALLNFAMLQTQIDADGQQSRERGADHQHLGVGYRRPEKIIQDHACGDTGSHCCDGPAHEKLQQEFRTGLTFLHKSARKWWKSTPDAGIGAGRDAKPIIRYFRALSIEAASKNYIRTTLVGHQSGIDAALDEKQGRTHRHQHAAKEAVLPLHHFLVAEEALHGGCRKRVTVHDHQVHRHHGHTHDE